MHRKRTRIDMYDTRVDLTPMIDLTFLLVMFFVLTSTFVSLNLEDVFLSVSKNAEDRQPQSRGNVERSVVVNIVRSDKEYNARVGKIKFGGKEHTWETLEKELRGEARYDEILRGFEPGEIKGQKLSKLEVLVRADEGIRGQALRQVFEVCSKIGIYKVKLAAMQKK